MKIDNSTIINNTPKIPEKLPEDSKRLMEVCQQFEAIFVNMMFKQMRATVIDGGLTEKSNARDIYQSLHDEQLSEEISKGQGIGLAKELYNQLSGATRTTIRRQE
ncbi:rod-binding protein [Alkaliphilus serpentinus]|uniref:Flagellar biosynthesis protein FlgJ n=1 Tax=Alkaliphilus serpentinus TaxID=1482731 RepID=A0A833M665_9FIRM|nr:rod-binding protein [Alkaliphilus serpentinus]KAB3526662.1 flagellar biosynthesis protein FlgJ [Alkaliphilus serpentinus]